MLFRWNRVYLDGIKFAWLTHHINVSEPPWTKLRVYTDDCSFNSGLFGVFLGEHMATWHQKCLWKDKHMTQVPTGSHLDAWSTNFLKGEVSLRIKHWLPWNIDKHLIHEGFGSICWNIQASELDLIYLKHICSSWCHWTVQ